MIGLGTTEGSSISRVPVEESERRVGAAREQANNKGKTPIGAFQEPDK